MSEQLTARERATQALNVFPHDSAVLAGISDEKHSDVLQLLASLPGTEIDTDLFDHRGSKFSQIRTMLHGLAGHAIDSRTDLSSQAREEAIAFLRNEMNNLQTMIQALQA